MSRSLVTHHSAPVAGCTVMPTQLRMPVAKLRPAVSPVTLYTRTLARFSSLPQAAPRPCWASQALSSSGDFFVMSSATLDCDPTDTYMRLPSGENAMSRVKCQPPTGDSCGTTTSGTLEAVVSPVL